MKRIDIYLGGASQLTQHYYMVEIYRGFKTDGFSLGGFFRLQRDLGLQMNELDIPANRHEIIKDALID